jgi:ABC-type Mn2+/Zn2+ transport system permease subunit
MAALHAILETFPAALLAGVVIAGACAVLGVFVVLKRLVFIGAVLSQVAACGVSIGLFYHVHPLISAMLFTIGAVTLLAFPMGESRIPSDAIMGLLFVLASTLGILFVSESAFGLEEVKALLYGNLILATPHDLRVLLWGVIPATALLIVFLRPVVYTLVDREEAKVLGLQVRVWELLFFYVLGVVISAASKLGGMLLVFCYLVVPPMTALLLSRRLLGAMLISVGLAIAATLSGVYYSYVWDLPTNQVIATVSCALLLGALAVKALLSLAWRLRHVA